MIGTVLTVAKGGAGVIRDGEGIVFVPGVISGETVEFSVAGRRRSVRQGRLLRVLESSPLRVQPPCPHYGECGGCNLQHMDYGEQLRCKREILLDNLKRVGRLEAPAGVEFLASPPWRYRSKVEFQVRAGRAGFFARESHHVVALGACPLLPGIVEDFYLDQCRRAVAGENGQVRIISNGHELAARRQTAAGGAEWLGDKRSLRFTVGGTAYDFTPDNFIQANLFQLRAMVELLEGFLERERPQTAADLFCGAGFFTLPLAVRCRSVLAMENEPGNVASLRANLDLNLAGNVRVSAADVLRAAIPAVDLIVVDPPRGGLSVKLIAALAENGARAIVYFSCDSATFSRDLRLLAGHGFELEELKLIDNFPQSDHFEIFSVLKKK
jgi:23S rRNA (uracil1939-C5)-methyltransferase